MSTTCGVDKWRVALERDRKFSVCAEPFVNVVVDEGTCSRPNLDRSTQACGSELRACRPVYRRLRSLIAAIPGRHPRARYLVARPVSDEPGVEHSDASLGRDVARQAAGPFDRPILVRIRHGRLFSRTPIRRPHDHSAAERRIDIRPGRLRRGGLARANDPELADDTRPWAASRVRPPPTRWVAARRSALDRSQPGASGSAPRTGGAIAFSVSLALSAGVTRGLRTVVYPAREAPAQAHP
jgi:hypothetical protein